MFNHIPFSVLSHLHCLPLNQSGALNGQAPDSPWSPSGSWRESLRGVWLVVLLNFPSKSQRWNRSFHSAMWSRTTVRFLKGLGRGQIGEYQFDVSKQTSSSGQVIYSERTRQIWQEASPSAFAKLHITHLLRFNESNTKAAVSPDCLRSIFSARWDCKVSCHYPQGPKWSSTVIFVIKSCQCTIPSCSNRWRMWF